jgi:DnaK suppressor protein
MKKETLKKFKKLFDAQKNVIQGQNSIICDDFRISPDDRYDEVDQARADIEQAIRMQLKNRETAHLKKVDEALRRIENGTFGLCEECDEDIELKRLEARPTATLCVGCKEDQERREILTVSKANQSVRSMDRRRFLS